MAKIEISGEVVYVGAPVKYSDKFTKAEIVVKDSTSKYPEFIKFEAINDKIELMQLQRVLSVARNTKRKRAGLDTSQVSNSLRFTKTSPRL
jgi:hypothetical protein